ncbi:hypothetical protein K3177_15085 [Qipengyuania sp. GH25]|uniref:DUF6438 domain-containing protein n=1 Tax=Qipengyuania pacifica TaxID=2860199 RepID=A0ABS7JKC2_9SPHN|nr:hypothetical protein [Qipengyuania aerophila]
MTAGPCFGFCPVYELSLFPDDMARFTGIRHTQLIGTAKHRVSRIEAERIRSALKPFEPASDRTFPCANARTDATDYTITWQTEDDEHTLVFDSGCADPEARSLNELLQGLPASLGFLEEGRQVIREGATRG